MGRALCDWWLARYPGPGGITAWWFGLTAPAEQLDGVLPALPVGADGAVSGDVAVDLLDPWRRPALLVVYARTGADLASAGLVPVAERQSATAALVVPADPGVWAPLSVSPRARPERCPVQVADGLQILFYVLNAPGPDADEAARRWRRQLREHQASLS